MLKFSLPKKGKLRLLKIISLIILITVSLVVIFYLFLPSIKYYLHNLGIGDFFSADKIETDNSENNVNDSVEFQILREDELIIPKIGVRILIVEGEDESALEHGAWRLPQSSTPDQGSNTVLSAHRFKYRPPHEETFYLLDKLEQGDTFLVFWQGKEYNYRVVSSSIVMPDDLEVIKPTVIPTVTLITCYPLFSNEKRLIVKGEIITNE